VRADQVDHTYAKLPVALWGTIAIASFLVVVQWPVIRRSVLIAWYGAIWATTALRFTWLLAYRTEQTRRARADVHASRFFSGAVVAGVVWGTAGVLLFPAGDIVHQVFLAFAFAGMTAGGTTTMAASWKSVVIFLGLTLLPLTVRFLVVGDRTHLIMGAMVLLFIVALLQTAKRVHDTLRETFLLRADVVAYREQLRKSEVSRRSLVDNLPVGLFRCVKGFEGKFSYASPAMAHLLGYDSTAALEEVSIASRFADSSDRERIVAEIRAQGSVHGEECRLKKRNGDEIWVSLSGSAVADVEDEEGELFDGVLEDISDQIEGRQALRDAHDRLHAVLTALPDLMFEVGGGRIHAVHAPDAALGFASSKETVGKLIEEVMPADAAAVIAEGIEEAAREGRSVGRSCGLDTPDGRRELELWIAKKGRAGDPRGRMVVLMRDITERGSRS